MSIDELLARNLRALNLHPIFHRRLVTPDAAQIALTQKWLLPHEEPFLAELRAIRKEVDQEMLRRPEIVQIASFQPQPYPYGFCKQIRDTMFERIKAAVLDPRYPTLAKNLHEFIKEGGIMQPFWGIDKELYFQNAIQIGDIIVDVANDTVTLTKEPVILYRSVATAVIKRVESFTEFATIAQRYWHHEVYPNIYLPQLSPVFPMIAIEPTKKASGGESRLLFLQADVSDIYTKNFFTVHDGHVLGLASEFLFESEFATKRLPREVEESFLKSQRVKRLREHSAKWYTPSVHEEDARVAFSTLRVSDTEDSTVNQHAARVRSIRDAGRRLERVILGEDARIPATG